MLICPICKKTLEKIEKSYICNNGHSFDIAKSSYANLLISNKSGNDIGDNKEMVCARTNFLNLDFYKRLADKLCDIASLNENITYLDCGCGQGYYTSKISNSLNNSKCFATDISKHAIIHASKRDKNTTYFVGSVFDLPILDNSIDLLTCLFAPLAKNEFSRVLKTSGKIIAVMAGEDHLFELKSEIYDHPYKNDDNKYDFSEFNILSKENLKYKVSIEDNQAIKQLFLMTPYSFKTSKEDFSKLDVLENLEVTLDFAIYILENLK